MKAWLVRERGEFIAAVVFAETRGKAKVLAQSTEACEDVDFLDIEIRRIKEADKYYVPGKTELYWFKSEDRIALVKDCGFTCDCDCFDIKDCPYCPARVFCDLYKDRLGGENDAAD